MDLGSTIKSIKSKVINKLIAREIIWKIPKDYYGLFSFSVLDVGCGAGSFQIPRNLPEKIFEIEKGTWVFGRNRYKPKGF